MQRQALVSMQSPIKLVPIVVALLCSACSSPTQTPIDRTAPAVERLTARPLPSTTTIEPGTYGLLLGVPKDALLTIPASAPQTKVPLVVMLHGAGGTQSALDTVVARAQQMGFAVLIPKSRGSTWDLAMGGFAEDPPLINKALEETFKKVNVDPARIAVAGFSDGASYAIALGTANGDFFTHIIAFSPGFLAAVTRHGKPPIFVAHGRDDGILPFESTSNNIVPFLKNLGYDVRFDAFSGGHRIDPTEATLAFQWFLGS
jgi:phospholipase/carboxylesterase